MRRGRGGLDGMDGRLRRKESDESCIPKAERGGEMNDVYFFWANGGDRVPSP